MLRSPHDFAVEQGACDVSASSVVPHK